MRSLHGPEHPLCFLVLGRVGLHEHALDAAAVHGEDRDGEVFVPEAVARLRERAEALERPAADGGAVGVVEGVLVPAEQLEKVRERHGAVELIAAVGPRDDLLFHHVLLVPDVATNPDIKTVADLAGKKVSIGAAGSGVYFNAIDVLNAYDLKESDISAVYQNFGDSAESLKDGKIDAAFIVAGAPTTAITDLATAGSVYLVSLDDSHVQSLLAASPYYTAATIKAGTY